MVWNIKPDSNARGTIYVDFWNTYSKEWAIIDPKTGGELDFGEHSSRVWGHFNTGKPHPEPDVVPKIAFTKARKRFPLIFSIFGHFCAQKPFVDFVESFEPGMHEFFPIQLVVKKTGEELPVQYFLMNICQVLESVVLDHPSVRVKYMPEINKYSWHQTQTVDVLFFHRHVVEGHHFWTDKGGGGEKQYMPLMNSLRRLKLRE